MCGSSCVIQCTGGGGGGGGGGGVGLPIRYAELLLYVFNWFICCVLQRVQCVIVCTCMM